MKTKIDDLDARAIDRADQSDAIDAEMKRLSDERKAHESGDAKALTDVVEALSKTLVKDQAAASHKKDAVKAEKKQARSPHTGSHTAALAY